MKNTAEKHIDIKFQTKIGLFVTCLVDFFRPNIGHACVKLITDLGYQLIVPEQQVCCGQPNYNSGDFESALKSAQKTIELFEECDRVVVPSGSCAAMIIHHFPVLFKDDLGWKQRADDLAKKTTELTDFLYEHIEELSLQTDYPHDITYHDSCSGLRELGIKHQPRALLEKSNLSIIEMENSEVCCGFGGTFCVKYPKISEAIVSKKTDDIRQSKAHSLLAGDLGCLLNIAGRASREDNSIQCYHIAEVLAGMTDCPPITSKHEG